MKINYKTILTVDSKQYVSESGNPEKELYEYKDVNGKKELVKNGCKTNVYDLIQSHRLETDINTIIARFLNGDPNVLNKAAGTYGDFTVMPKTYAELYARLQECENIFNKLPVEVRAEFGHSASKFWSEYGNEHFTNTFSKYFGRDTVDSSTVPVDEKGEEK